jgi:hypothetical protein
VAGPSKEGDPPYAPFGSSGAREKSGDRATALIEDICCENISWLQLQARGSQPIA